MNSSEKFSDYIIKQAGDFWDRATDHIFIQEMVISKLNRKSFSNYLIQDYAFVDSFLDLVSHMIAYSKTINQKHRLSTFLSMATSEENQYFIRSFKELGVKESDYCWKNIKRSSVIKRFDEEIKKAIKSNSYEDCLIVLFCAESVYCEWATKYEDKNPKEFYFKEWMTLHNNPEFKEFVLWLRSEVDSLNTLAENRKAELSNTFTKVCELEALFFDESYNN